MARKQNSKKLYVVVKVDSNSPKTEFIEVEDENGKSVSLPSVGFSKHPTADWLHRIGPFYADGESSG